MDEMYGLHPTAGDYSDKALMSPENLIMSSSDYHSLMNGNTTAAAVRFGSDELISATCMSSESASDDTSTTSFIKAKIASHPHYPRLLQSYIDCHKVSLILPNFTVSILCDSSVMRYTYHSLLSHEIQLLFFCRTTTTAKLN